MMRIRATSHCAEYGLRTVSFSVFVLLQTDYLSFLSYRVQFQHILLRQEVFLHMKLHNSISIRAFNLTRRSSLSFPSDSTKGEEGITVNEISIDLSIL